MTLLLLLLLRSTSASNQRSSDDVDGPTANPPSERYFKDSLRLRWLVSRRVPRM